MSDRFVQVDTLGGGRLRITRVPRSAEGPGESAYEIALTAGPRADTVTERIPISLGHDIVKFIGYPQEVPPERQTVEEALARAREAEAAARLWQVSFEQLKSHATVLVNELQGAWWLKAAHAYEGLRALLLDHLVKRVP